MICEDTYRADWDALEPVAKAKRVTPPIPLPAGMTKQAIGGQAYARKAYQERLKWMAKLPRVFMSADVSALCGTTRGATRKRICAMAESGEIEFVREDRHRARHWRLSARVVADIAEHCGVRV